jgi:polyisoprenoid-binding protein YceI
VKTFLAPLMLLLAAAGPPAPLQLPVRPDTAVAGFSVRALGFWPMQGHFQQFSGVVELDPAHPGRCAVDVSVDLASLHMADPAVQADVLSPALLDAATYPRLVFRGSCDGDAVDGSMTLHGVTHPLRLLLRQRAGRWIAEGSFHRADWGITGRPLLAGQEVKVTFSVATQH